MASCDTESSSGEDEDFTKQKIGNYSWTVSNVDGSSPFRRKNSFLIPKSMRGVICGSSGCGKTSLLTFLLLEKGLLDYNSLYVIARSIHQPEYQVLKHGFEKGLTKSQIQVLFQMQKQCEQEGGLLKVLDSYNGPLNNEDCKTSWHTDTTTISDPSGMSTDRNNLIIFDDLLLEPQNMIEKYYTRGRHQNTDAIYVTQNWFRLPKATIRENGNLFFFFPQDHRTVMHIYYDLCSADGFSLDLFRQFCKRVWTRKYNFVLIDASREAHLGKYRRNLNDFWIPPPTSFIDDMKTVNGEKEDKKVSFEGGEGLFTQTMNEQLRRRQEQRRRRHHEGNGKKRQKSTSSFADHRRERRQQRLIQFYPVHTIKDEQELLKDIVDVQTAIRAQKEKKRLQEQGTYQQYAKVFEPITRTLLTLDQVQEQRQQQNNDRKRKKRDVTPPRAYQKAEEEEEEEDDSADFDDDDDDDDKKAVLPDMFSTPTTSKKKIKNSPISSPSSPPPVLYTEALHLIGKNNLDDGLFGCNDKTKTIGGMPYSVSSIGNLTIHTEQQGRLVFNIKQLNVWIMFLAKTPSEVVKIDQVGSLTNKSSSSSPVSGARPGYVKRWKDICTQLELVPLALKSKVRRAQTRDLYTREKFKLLQESEGSGLVTVLASDKNGLLRQLQLAAAEYEAGNKDLLSVITAGVKEANRLRIPKAKLSFLKNIPQTFNWI